MKPKLIIWSFSTRPGRIAVATWLIPVFSVICITAENATARNPYRKAFFQAYP
ncbi:MAG: hypothetical protein ACYS1A_19590 [Planctomycetota bacterium]